METKNSTKKVVPESAFVTGWSQVPPYCRDMVMQQLMEAFGIRSKIQFYARMRGEVEPRKSQIEGIEAVFNRYGITVIWGLEPYSNLQQP